MAEEYKKYVNQLSFRNKLGRLVWNIVWAALFRPFGTRIFRRWRIFLLRLFGAKISWKAGIYASVRIWAPWNLTMDDYACIAQNVRLHNVAMIEVGEGSTVSQGAFLCTASHDIYSIEHPLITKSIRIGKKAWVASDAFVGMGITIGEGAVVGARAAVFKDVEPWTVVGGNPAKVIGKREFRK